MFFSPQPARHRFMEHPDWAEQADEETVRDVAVPGGGSLRGGFADDLRAFADTPRKLQGAHRIAVLWTLASDMDINYCKSRPRTLATPKSGPSKSLHP